MDDCKRAQGTDSSAERPLGATDSERLALAVAGSEDGLWDWDLVTGEMYLSPQWKRIVGYEDYELPNAFETWARLLHPADVAETTKRLVDYIEGRTSAFRVEFRQQHRDGTARWILAQATALRDEVGRAYRVAGSHTDVTARRQAELERDRFFTLSRDPLCVVGADGALVRVNPAFEKVLGWSPDDVLGKPWAALVHADDPSAAKLLVRGGEAHHTFENRYRCKDGSYRWLSWSAVRSEEETVFGTARDVTDRKEAESELQRARDLALESARLKSEFLANMSHEIRTPMNGVIGMASLLRDTHLDDDQRRCLNTIVGSAEALLVIINDILDFSKIEAGKMTLDATEIELRGLVDDVLELLAERADQKGLALYADVARDVPTFVFADGARLRQILTNLLGNAVKFTDHGEVCVRIDVLSQEDGDVVLRFEVADTGIGISPEAQARLFQPFTQADGSTTRRYGGTGLGLVICQRLCQLMGGEIGINSAAGAGSTFHFTARLGQVAREDPRASARKPLAGRRLLCVSAHETWLPVLVRLLRGLGATTLSAPNRERAAQRIAESAAAAAPLDAIILVPGAAEEEPSALLAPFVDGEGEPPLCLALGWRQMSRVTAHLRANPRSRPLRTVPLPLREERLLAALDALARGVPLELGALAAAAAASQASAATRPPTAIPISCARVLLVEDNAVNQQVASRLLQRLGCTVEIAGDGRSAVERWRAANADLILMDCQMPEMDGFEATREIRAQEGDASARIPIIALTANAMQGDRERCVAAGMDDYVTKPIGRNDLERVLRAHTPRKLIA